MNMLNLCLDAIFLQHAGLPFRLTQLEGNMELGFCAGELRAAVPLLLRQGKLEAVKNKSGEVLLRINEEGLAMVANEWVAEALIDYDPFNVVIDRECGEGLLYTVLHWLGWIHFNGLPLTAKGTLFRKTIDALQALTPFEDEQLKGLQLQLTVQEDLPISVAFMLDILVKMSVLRLEAGEWSIQDECLQTWLKLDLKTANKKLLTILCKNYVPARKYQQQIVALLTCSLVRQGQLCILDIVISKLPLLESNSTGVREELTMWLNSWLYVLCQCGWLEQGRLAQNSSVFVLRWCEGQYESSPAFNQASNQASQRESKLESNIKEQLIIVQPDFEILVPPDVPLALRYELELLTECVHIDVMSQYRLTKRKFCLALQSGLSWRFPSDLPAHIEMTIDEWTKEANLYQAHHTALEKNKLKSKSTSKSKSKSISKNISKNMANSLLQGGKINATCFVQPSPQLPTYEACLEAPDFSSILPDLGSVPLKWRQQISSYHPSTLRHLIEQAITWQIKVELQLAQDRVAIIPTSICDELDGWRVVGVITSPSLGEPNSQVIPHQQCYGAKLLVPEIDTNNVSTFYSDSCNNML